MPCRVCSVLLASKAESLDSGGPCGFFPVVAAHGGFAVSPARLWPERCAFSPTPGESWDLRCFPPLAYFDSCNRARSQASRCAYHSSWF